MKKISVIIPCYNAAPYIDRCLTSIVTQTVGTEELEIICVDDASTDDTWIRLQEWEHCLPEHILLIHLETNQRLGGGKKCRTLLCVGRLGCLCGCGRLVGAGLF